jgi:hypothetical protein
MTCEFRLNPSGGFALAHARRQRQGKTGGSAEMQRRRRRYFMQGAAGKTAAERGIDGRDAKRQRPSLLQQGLGSFVIGYRLPKAP